MKESQRKCFKCGRSPAADPAVKLFRFPRPGTTNTLRSELWAKYCFPEKECDTQLQIKMYAEHRMLCDSHFHPSSFNDFSKKILVRSAVPCTTRCLGTSGKEILHDFPKPNLEPDRFRSWIYAIGGDILALENQFIFQNRRVCHKHFEERFHTRSRMLSRNAVPTLHLSAKGPAQFSGQQEDEQVVDADLQPDLTEDLSCSSKTETAAPVAPSEKAKEPAQFSWQQEDEQVVDADLQPDPAPLLFEDLSCSSKTDTAAPVVPSEKEHAPSLAEKTSDTADEDAYQCNICLGQIKGFRYACVECADWDMCGACEARGAHPLHYVLRIPPHRPHAEVRARLRSIRRALADAVVHVVPDADTIHEIKEEDEEYLEDPFEVNPSEHTNEETEQNSSDQDETHTNDETEENASDQYEKGSDLNAGESDQEVDESESVAEVPAINVVPKVVALRSAEVGKLVTPCVKKVKVLPFDRAITARSILKPFQSSIVQKTPIHSPQGVHHKAQIIQKAPPQSMRKVSLLKAQFVQKVTTEPGGHIIVKKVVVPIGTTQNVENESDEKNSSQAAVDRGMEKIRAVTSDVKQPSVAGPLRVQALPAGSAAAQIKKKITILANRILVKPDPPVTATIPMKEAMVRVKRLSEGAVAEAAMRARKRCRLAGRHTAPHAGHTATTQQHSDSDTESLS